MKGMGPNDWIGMDLAILPMVVAVICAGLARPKWVQWTAGVAMLGLNLVVLSVFAIPAG